MLSPSKEFFLSFKMVAEISSENTEKPIAFLRIHKAAYCNKPEVQYLTAIIAKRKKCFFLIY
jgi:hypothetical protein